jgi:hypothetical protein
VGGLSPKGILDLLTQKQRALVIEVFRSEWPHFRGDQHNGSSIRSLIKNEVIEEVGKGYYRLTAPARTAVGAHLKLMGE